MKKGFTLIELLIIMVIVGILVTLALPRYKGALEKGRGVEAMENAAALSAALNTYYVRNYNSYYAPDSSLTEDQQIAQAKSYMNRVAATTVRKDGDPNVFKSFQLEDVSVAANEVSVTLARKDVSADKTYKIKFISQGGEVLHRLCLASADTTGEKYCHSLGANKVVTGGWEF